VVLGFARIGWTEFLLILAVLVLVFGVNRFVQVKDAVVKAVRNLKDAAKGGAGD